MYRLEKITPPLVDAFKAIRLRALKEDPTAFGSTFARESAFTQAEWLNRVGNFNSPRGIGYLAVPEKNDLTPNFCGIAGGFLDENDPTKALLVAMWVAPEARRAGVGSLLIRGVESWAASRGARILRLRVTCNNDPAIELYRRNALSMTGLTEPYPNDPSLFEYEMAKPLESA
jgi:GNAT superfamily N-acetyltransferase